MFCLLTTADKCSGGFCLTKGFGHHYLVPQKSVNLVFKSFFQRAAGAECPAAMLKQGNLRTVVTKR